MSNLVNKLLDSGILTAENASDPITVTELGTCLEVLLEMNSQLQGRLAGAEKRVLLIEEKGVVFRGNYNQSDEYKRGDLVAWGGSVFHCTRSTQGISPMHDEGPKGKDHPWQLAVRRGRDSKDR